MSNQGGPTGDISGGPGGGGAAPGARAGQQGDGSEQAYMDIIQAAMGAALNADALPPAANSGLSAMQQAQGGFYPQLQQQYQDHDVMDTSMMDEKPLSMSGGDSVSSSVGMASPGMADRPLAISADTPEPEPHYYGMLKDDDGNDEDKSSASPNTSSRSLGRRPNGEGGYARRRRTKPTKRSESLGDIEYDSVFQEQLASTAGPMPMSGAASVDGGLPQVPNIEDPFGGPPAGTEIDFRRRHSTGALEYNDSDLDDYDILDMAPIDTEGGSVASASASASATPRSPRRAQRRPSGDHAPSKKPSKTVKKKSTKMKRRDSGNSVSSLDGAMAEIDVSGKKSRTWKKPKDKPKRPLSAYNLFFKHERAKIVNTVTDDAKPTETPSSDTATPSGGTKRRTHRVAHGKIGFAALARTVAARWKELPPDERSVFEARAAVEKARYKKEMEVWNKTQKDKRLADQRRQLKEYHAERMRQELLAQQQQIDAQQQMLMMQQQQHQQQQAQRPQFGDGTNDSMQMLMAMQQQQMSAANSTNMGNTQALSAVGGPNSNYSADVCGSATQAMNMQQQSQQNSFGELGGNMPNMNTGLSGTGNVLSATPQDGQQQQQLPTQDELRAQQTAKLQQIQQAQRILQMQAQAIQQQQQRQEQTLQQDQGGGSALGTSNTGSGSGSGNRAPPDNPEFYASMFNNLQAQSPSNSSNNSAFLQQMHQMMNNSLNSLTSQQSQHLQQQQQQQPMLQSAHPEGGNSGATGTTADARMGVNQMGMSANLTQPMAATENVFDQEVATNEELLRMLGSGLGLDQSGGASSGADDGDGEGDAQLREMLNQFDVGNLDPLGFNFGGTGGGSEK